MYLCLSIVTSFKITIINAFWLLQHGRLQEHSSSSRGTFFLWKQGTIFDFPQHAQFVPYTRFDRKVVHKRSALEKPLTDCVPRTQPLVCLAEELSWNCGCNFLFISGLQLPRTLLFLFYRQSGFTHTVVVSNKSSYTHCSNYSASYFSFMLIAVT